MNQTKTIEWLCDIHREEPEILEEPFLQGKRRGELKWSLKKWSFKKGDQVCVSELMAKDTQSYDFWLVHEKHQITGIKRSDFRFLD